MIEVIIIIMQVILNLTIIALLNIGLAYFWVCAFDMKFMECCDQKQLQKAKGYSVRKSMVVSFLVGLTMLPFAIVYWIYLLRCTKGGKK